MLCDAVCDKVVDGVNVSLCESVTVTLLLTEDVISRLAVADPVSDCVCESDTEMEGVSV